MDDILIRVLTRLLRVHDQLGSDVYEKAAHQDLIAIASAVQREAEIEAGGMLAARQDHQVIQFPLGKRLRNEDPPT